MSEMVQIWVKCLEGKLGKSWQRLEMQSFMFSCCIFIRDLYLQIFHCEGRLSASCMFSCEVHVWSTVYGVIFLLLNGKYCLVECSAFCTFRYITVSFECAVACGTVSCNCAGVHGTVLFEGGTSCHWRGDGCQAAAGVRQGGAGEFSQRGRCFR